MYVLKKIEAGAGVRRLRSGAFDRMDSVAVGMEAVGFRHDGGRSGRVRLE